MMNNTAKVILLASMLPFVANAAQELTPWYVGGGIGANNYEPNCDVKTMKSCGKDDPYAWDVFAGYLFNDYFGVELGYRDLGRAEWVDYANKMNDVGGKGMTLGVVGFWPIADLWSLSAETGLMNYLLSNNKEYGSEYYSDSGIAPYVGASIGYNISKNLKLQAKYRRYEGLDEDKWNTLAMDSNYWGFELSYRFGTPAPTVVAPTVVAAIDSDNDGVTDDIDRCADTPTTFKVDLKGCTIYAETTKQRDIGSIQFANNSSVVKMESYERIEKLATYMHLDPKTTVFISGHASDVGKADYNMELSDSRAKAIAQILVEQYDIAPSRIEAKGFGITQPIIEGNSAEANKVNRRIEVHITEVTKEALTK
ncbi:OmpA family protein [Shewanella atlantica]|uniref:OmpA family protein n=1 Tax=Shewanella atlantica TaxID=271099 RepID=A0A3S0JNJ5_9GAMM|nr:OmpA family protein [Shewanella atlantica]